MDKLISIIVPAYNSAKYIQETIDSVINQTYKNWELIIVDDCSSDNTAEIVKKKSIIYPRIKYIKNQLNFGGPAQPRNIGIKNSSGEFIAFLDSDDIWLANKLEIQLSYFEKYNDVLLVGTNCQTFPNGISNELFFFRNHFLSFNYLINNTKGIITSSVLMKRDVIEHIGLFDEDKKLIAVEDFDYWLRILKFKDNSIFVLNQSLVKYRMHEQNISLALNSKDNFSVYDKLLIIYQKHEKEASKLILFIKKNLHQLKAELAVKEAFYQNKITYKTLLADKAISFKSKITILVKNFIMTLLRLIKF